MKKTLRGRRNVILLFVASESQLTRRFPAAARALELHGGLWVAYPKKSSSISTDLTFETVQRTGLDAGLVDNKVAAIDDDWTAVRFAYRRAAQSSLSRGVGSTGIRSPRSPATRIAFE